MPTFPSLSKSALKKNLNSAIRAFMPMSSGLDLKEYGWNGGGTNGNGREAALLASMAGIVQNTSGESRFAD
jgi:hypothetical protein